VTGPIAAERELTDVKVLGPNEGNWDGPPSRYITKVILRLTHVDKQGRRFYRLSPTSPWKRLRTPADFAELNEVVDSYRNYGQNGDKP